MSKLENLLNEMKEQTDTRMNESDSYSIMIKSIDNTLSNTKNNITKISDDLKNLDTEARKNKDVKLALRSIAYAQLLIAEAKSVLFWASRGDYNNAAEASIQLKSILSKNVK